MRDSICQHCFNFNCSWHKEFKPVKGWRAKPTQLCDVGKSYCVEKCPKYVSRDNNDFVLTNTHEICQICGFSWRTLMRRMSQNVRAVERLLFKKGFVLKIDREDGAKYNRYYLQKFEG